MNQTFHICAPLTGDLFTARFADCHFDEENFPSMGNPKASIEEKQKKEDNFSWREKDLTHLDPRTSECENEVQRIIRLQEIANRLPDAFNDATKVTKSHIPAVNTPARIHVPEEHEEKDNNAPRLKRGRPVGSRDVAPRKKRGRNQDSMFLPSEQFTNETTPEEVKIMDPGNNEISINYYNDLWNRNEIVIDDIFAFSVANEIINDDYEPRSITECRQRHDWPKWKEAIQVELASLAKRDVFGPVARTPENVIPVGYKWVFVRKRNEKNEIVRYKARLVAQGFSQRPGIDYDETYSPVMDTITFRFLISMVVSKNLEMRLMDVVTAYLYGSLDSDIYMKIPEGLKMPEAYTPRNLYSIKLQRSLYGLKQSDRMWYNRLSEYLVKEGYKNDPLCPCVFIKKSKSGFAILAVYVDDINIIGTSEELTKTVEYLKREFEVKDLGKTKLCLGLEL